MNESASYVDCGHWQYERNKTVPAIPGYVIFDQRRASITRFGVGLPGAEPKEYVGSGMFNEGRYVG